ncbi:MAG: spondin domain-containing protein [Acidiferrobacterales bacterium]|nr:spondin domain-containing protein [Acidiferrobacterales bacterium]
MRKSLLIAAIVLSASMAGCDRVKDAYEKAKFWEGGSKSDEIQVKVTNITSGTYLTQILAVGHNREDETMFEYGSAASTELQAVAEGGNIEPIAGTFSTADSQIVKDPNNGLLGPGESTTFTIGKGYSRLSLIAQILPTNDGFVAANNIVIREGIQELYAIDAGTEANDEQITGGGAPNTPGIPADPGGLATGGATGIASAVIEGKVDRHPGISGGEGSALNPQIHGWSGAIAVLNIEM